MAATIGIMEILVIILLLMPAEYLRRLICFDRRVNEFQRMKRKLQSVVIQLQEDARMRHVIKLKEEAENVLKAVITLEGKIQEKERGLTSRFNLNHCSHLMKEIVQDEENINSVVRTYWENEAWLSSCSDPSQALKSALTKIVEAMEDGSVSAIAVCGQRGQGKTTLAGAVKKVAENYLELEVVLLDVSQCTTIEKVQDALAAFFKLRFEKETEEERAEELGHRLKNERKILILDDFCKGLNLKSIGIPEQVKCIILLTSDTRACSSMGCSKVIKLGALNTNEALELLEKHLGQKITSDFTHVASLVAEQCRNSPLAIKTLRRALRGKNEHEWREAYYTLNSELKTEESEEARIVYRSVKLSYDQLECRETKVCFLLCSLFPKDDPIAAQDLVTYSWVLGIYQDIDSIEGVREKVYGAIKSLIDSFLFSEHGESRFQMQNAVREAALSIASEDESLLQIKSVVRLWERPEIHHLFVFERPEDLEAISYVVGKPEELLEEEFQSEKVQVLFPSRHGIQNLSNEVVQWLKALKVLAVHHGSLLRNVVQNLTNLRALHLENCKLIGLSSLGSLKTLEILRFHGIDISYLPDEIGELDNLKLLELFDCLRLQKIPLNLLQRLSRLEELYFSGCSFEGWSEGRSSEGSTKIISVSSLPTESLEYQKSFFTEWFDTSRALKVSVSVQNRSTEWNGSVKYLHRDHIVCYKDHVSPNLVQSVKRLRVEDCGRLQAVFEDGIIRHDIKENSEELLSNLTSLELKKLDNLIWIWYGQTNNVSLRDLSVVKLEDCPCLKFLFSMSVAQCLKQLETLEIHGCNELKQIIAKTEDIHVGETIDPQCFPRLKTLQISDCHALEFIFQIRTGQILPKLTQMEISGCPKLVRVFNLKQAEQDGKDIELLQLRNLALKNLIGLTTFCSENRSVKLPSLKEFQVGECRQFGNDAMHQVIKHCRLGELCLSKVGNQLCGAIFELPIGYFLSSLKKLKLEEISELQHIWEEATKIVTLQNLTHLELVECNKLKDVFSLIHARNLLQLSHLAVKNCKSLEQIVGGDRILASSSSYRLKAVYFPNLVEIVIQDCDNLKSLFPISANHLSKLKIKGAKFRQTIKFEGEAAVKSEEEVELRFPKLETLHLEKLKELITINPVGYECVFPVLRNLVKKECPSLLTKFSKGDSDSEPNVCARIEKRLYTQKEKNSRLARSVTFLTNDGDIVWSLGEENGLKKPI